MHADLTHEELNDLCRIEINKIGQTYGRMIFGKISMFDLEIEEAKEGIDAAVEDYRDTLKAGGACEHDLEICCNTLKLAILQELKRHIIVAPDHPAVLQ